MSALLGLSIAFIILDLIIIAIGMLMGYFRGTGRSLVRLVYLAIIGVISFFASRAIAFAVSPKILSVVIKLIPTDLHDMITDAPVAMTIIENLMGGIISAILIAVVFGILQALTMIGLKALSKKIVGAIYKKEEPTASRWIGLGVGLVTGVLVSVFLLAPIFTVLYWADNISPDTAVEYFEYDSEAAAENSFKSTKLFPLNKLLADAVTSYDVPCRVSEDIKKDNALNAVPVLLDVGKDALEVFAATKENGGNDTDATSNAIASASPHRDRSVTLRRIAIDMMVSIATTLEDGGYVLGLHFVHSDNALIEDIRPALISAIKNCHEENINKNLITFFGDINGTIVLNRDGSVSVVGSYTDGLKANAHSNGLFAAMHELNNHNSEGIPHESTAVSTEIALVVRHMSSNDDMDGVLKEIKSHITDPLKDQGIDISDEKYIEVYDTMADTLTSLIKLDVATGDVNVEDIASSLEEQLVVIFDLYSLPFDSTETSIFATCVAKEFASDEYISGGNVDITSDDIIEFFNSAE